VVFSGRTLSLIGSYIPPPASGLKEDMISKEQEASTQLGAGLLLVDFVAY
jgi:hypothetical protein